MLTLHGIDTALVDPARLDTLVRRVATTGNSVALDSLVRAGVPPGPVPPIVSLRQQGARSTGSPKSDPLYCRGSP